MPAIGRAGPDRTGPIWPRLDRDLLAGPRSTNASNGGSSTLGVGGGPFAVASTSANCRNGTAAVSMNNRACLLPDTHTYLTSHPPCLLGACHHVIHQFLHHHNLVPTKKQRNTPRTVNQIRLENVGASKPARRAGQGRAGQGTGGATSLWTATS